MINFRDFIGLPTRMIVAQLELRLFNQRGVILVVDFDRGACEAVTRILEPNVTAGV
ncbi:MAG: hypothetical protein GWP56_11240 [Gammaproteobacteria bacterium]|nr:hypothetical protein [Gammaproteobacteria bacterium]